MLLKAIPWAGYGVAALMFWFWIGLKEDLAQQVELCNQQKLESVAEAERLTRTALQASLDRRLSELEGIAEAESNARQMAEAERQVASEAASDAQATIRRLIAEAETDETQTIEQICLLTDVPTAILDGLQ